jgi:hypothetical protein|tara:strand:- start:240 stop:563 length:324 start_codon:yes stop_codon:yes gene_type:complete
MKVQDGNNTKLTGSDLKEYIAKRFGGDTPDPALSYHGWANYQTWNVALWLQNDERLYGVACQYQNWGDLKSHLPHRTPDGVRYDDPTVNVEEIEQMLSELTDDELDG